MQRHRSLDAQIDDFSLFCSFMLFENLSLIHGETKRVYIDCWLMFLRFSRRLLTMIIFFPPHRPIATRIAICTRRVFSCVSQWWPSLLVLALVDFARQHNLLMTVFTNVR